MFKIDLPIASNPLRTRGDVQQAVRQLIEPLKPYYSSGSARVSIGNTSASYEDAVAGMEGFSRVLWGIMPLISGGSESILWEQVIQGIINGTDPEHVEYWGAINDYDQRIVEMAAYGLALVIAPDQLWGALSAKEQHNFAAWLRQASDRKAYDCNWLFFAVLVNLGLKAVGEPYDQAVVEQNLERIDAFYLSDGWYADGVKAHSDYYVPFAIYYYGLFYAKVMEQEDPVRSERYKSRASAFASDFIYWFAEDGSALPYGRSLAYRFAQAAFWGAMAYAEVEAIPYGVQKGLLLRQLRWWFKQPIFQRDGTLTIGYAYPNLIMAENYNSPGSPYWALKAFLPLALDESHPFWQVEELPLPKLEPISVQPAPHLVICRQPEKSHLVAFNTGHATTNEHTHTSAKYEKFAYSNVFGFSVPRAEWGLGQGAFDSMLALSEGDNIYRVKRKNEESRIEGNMLYARWKPWADVEVKTWLIAGAPWHIRVHCIDSGRELDTADGGFALGLESLEGLPRGYKTEQDEHGVLAVCAWGVSGVRVLYGPGQAELIYPNSNTNLMNPRTVIPTVRTSLQPGVHLLVTAVYAEPGSNETYEQQWANGPVAAVKDGQLTLKDRDGGKLLFSHNIDL
ncbi:DUF2264 domain-containing protein [Paenibacillus paridis]|uniref:DUF2264 domain-containing protein n=1 Tax=Paenibacillus paridis TaxID=2583376 RepID=UPI00111CDA66|nr:DUF2264 domain-containing protein [Paenibacillus paridis]